MKKNLSLIFLIILFCGCAKVRHLDKLLVLKGMADEKTRLAGYVEAQDQKFEALLKAVKDESIRQYDTKEKISGAFGEPVYRQEVRNDMPGAAEEWMYRYATQLTGSPKVYLYFDISGRLLRWETKLPEKVKE